MFVVTAPSGTGKTTLNRRLVQENPRIELAISTTTRKKRESEENGVHYWFVSEHDFFERVKQGAMLEWANVHGNFYGTSHDEILRIQNRGHKVLLEIDVQGFEQLRDKFPKLVSIFLMPPSLEMLWQRLAQRGTDNLATRFHRIQNARNELESGLKYEYYIVNDSIDSAYAQLLSIIDGSPALSLDRASGRKHCQSLLDAFATSKWLNDISAQLKKT